MAGPLTRWEPLSELSELRSSFLDRMFGDWLDGHDRARMPDIDILREDGHLVLRADMPGIKPEDVKIEVLDDVLTVSGEHEEREEKHEKDYVRRERRYGSFRRSMMLPSGVDATTITAKSHDGVVEVTIPLPEEAKHETVTITPTVA